MSDIAKKYVKALILSVDKDKLTAISDSLNSIVPAFRDLKFKIALSANDISKDKKVELITSMIDGCDEKLVNLFKLLADYGRLDILPEIAKELDFEVANLLNTYHGVVISDKDISEDKISQIAQNLSKKFDTTIELSAKKSDYNGIKVEVESLGVEIALSTDRLKAQLTEYILKAI